MTDALPADWLRAALSLTPALCSLHAGTTTPQTDVANQRASKDDAALIMRALQGHQRFIQDDALERLRQCQLRMFSNPLFSAHAAREQDREIIVLFEGLLVVMQTTLEMSYAITNLPDELDSVYPQSDFPTVSALGWLSVLFARLIHGYAARGEPAPNFAALLNGTRNTEIHYGLIGGLWVTILHELGHHACGHVSAKHPVTQADTEDDLLVHEDLTRYQRCEIEADRYAFDALTTIGQVMHMSWINTALGAQMLFDSLLTIRTDTHPLSVNRLSRFLSDYAPTPAGIAPEKMTAHLKQHARIFKTTEEEHKKLESTLTSPLIAGLDRHQVEGLINSLAPTFAHWDIDIRRVLQPPTQSWREYLQHLPSDS